MSLDLTPSPREKGRALSYMCASHGSPLSGSHQFPPSCGPGSAPALTWPGHRPLCTHLSLLALSLSSSYLEERERKAHEMQPGNPLPSGNREAISLSHLNTRQVLEQKGQPELTGLLVFFMFLSSLPTPTPPQGRGYLFCWYIPPSGVDTAQRTFFASASNTASVKRPPH